MSLDANFWLNTRIVNENGIDKVYIPQGNDNASVNIYKRVLIDTSVFTGKGISLLPGKVFVITDNGKAYIDERTAIEFQKAHKASVKPVSQPAGKEELHLLRVSRAALQTEYESFKKEINNCKEIVDQNTKIRYLERKSQLSEKGRLLLIDMKETHKSHKTGFFDGISDNFNRADLDLTSWESHLESMEKDLNNLENTIRRMKTDDDVRKEDIKKQETQAVAAKKILEKSSLLFNDINKFIINLKHPSSNDINNSYVQSRINETYVYPSNLNSLPNAIQNNFDSSRNYENDLRNLEPLFQKDPNRNCSLLKLCYSGNVQERLDQLKKDIDMLSDLLSATNEDAIKTIINRDQNLAIMLLLSQPRGLIPNPSTIVSVNEIKQKVVETLRSRIMNNFNSQLPSYNSNLDTLISVIDRLPPLQGDYTTGQFFEFKKNMAQLKSDLLEKKQALKTLIDRYQSLVAQPPPYSEF